MRSINKQPKQAGFIFSVFQTKNSLKKNTRVHNEVYGYLKKRGVSLKEVTGKYTHDSGEIVSELSIYVQVNNKYDQHELRDLVKSHCLNANQESFLQLSASREVEIVPLQGKPQGIGVLTQVNEQEALNSPAYTYDHLNGTYFVAK